MNPLQRLASLTLLLLTLMGSLPTASAAPFAWDPGADGDGAIGGTGTWDLTSSFWDPTGLDPVTADNIVWPNLVDSIAVFGGTAGTVTIDTVADTGVTANGLTFNVTGYIINGATAAEVITLAGTTPTINVATLGDVATINAIVAGSSLDKTGSGTLVLTGANNYIGVTSVTAGVLNIQNATGLGTIAAGTTVASGAALELQGTIAVGAETLTLSGTGVGGAGALRNISGTNSWAGAVTITQATGASIMSDAGLLTISGATNGSAASTTLNVGGAGDITFSASTGSNISSMTKTGGGTLRFTADPNQTGTLLISGGVVELNHGGSTDFNTTIESGTTLRALTASVGDNFDITVNTGGTFDWRASDTIGGLDGGGLVTKGNAGAGTLTVNNNNETTVFSGVIENGLGTVSLTKNGSGTLTLTGTNTYTGSTTITNGTIIVSGVAGTLSAGAAATFTTVGDNNGNTEVLILGDNTDVTAVDRISDTGGLRFRGSTTVTYNGPAAGAASTTEVISGIDLQSGVGILNLNPAAGGELQINATTLTRSADSGSGGVISATGVIRGTGLGLAAGTTNSSRVLFSTAPTTIGTGGSGSAASIIAFLIGGNSATAAPDTFLRYDATNGVTLLGVSDYAATIAGSPNLNVSTAGGESVSADAFINALRVTGGTTTLSGASTNLTLGSGALLFTGTSTIGGTGVLTLGDGLVNGTGVGRQAIIHASADTTAITATISASLATAGGLAVGDAGNVANVVLLSGDNEIIGGITVNGGILRLGHAGALSDSYFNDLYLRAGNSSVTGGAATALQLSGNSVSVVFGGNDRLQGSTRIQNASATAATLTIVTNVTSGSNDGIMENGTGGGALSLIKRGTATLALEQNNTFTGTTEILQGTLQLTTANGRLTGTTGVTIRSGGILNLNNSNTANQTDRVASGAALNMHGGSFQHDNNQGTVNYSETIGVLNVLNGNNTITTDFAASGQTETLTFASLNGVAGRAAAGSAVNFQGFNTTGDVAIGEGVGRNRVVFTAAPTLSAGGILAGGNAYHTKDFNTGTTQDVVNFATYGDVDPGAGTSNSIFAFAGYNTGVESTWGATTVANPTADDTLTTNRTIEAIRLGGGIDIAQAGFTLNLSQGGLIHNGTDAIISGGTLTAGGTVAGELAIRTEDNLTTSTLLISSVIADNFGADLVLGGGDDGVVSLLKTGADNLTLSGTNTYTGRTTLQGGTVNFSTDANFGTAPSSATAGHLRLHGVTLNSTAAAGTTTLDGNRGLELGGGANTISQAAGGNLVYNASSITSNGNSSLALSGHVDMAVGSASTIGGNLSIQGSSGTGGSAVSFSGASNFIGGSLSVAVDSTIASGTASTGSLSYAVGGGTLTVGSSNPNGSNIDIGVRTNATIVQNNGTINLSGSDNFIANVDRLRLGIISSATSSGTTQGTLILSTNATIHAGAEVLLSNSGADGQSVAATSTIAFGSGISTLVTPLMTVSGLKGQAAITIAVGGTLNYSGFGAGTGDLFIARNIGNTGTVSTGNFNMTGGVLNANLDEVVIADKSGGGNGGATGTLTLDTGANNVVLESLVLGRIAGAASNTLALANGTLNMAGGTMVIRSDSIIASHDGTANGTARGTINLTGGTMTFGGTLAKAGTSRSSAILNVNGGTLDMQDQLGGDTTMGSFTGSQLTFRSGSIIDTASVTLDAVSVTNGVTVGALTDALILRDVSLAANVNLTSAVVSTGGVHYESAGGGAGGTLSGNVDLGTIVRTFNVEESAGAAADLTVSGVISNSGGIDKTGAGRLVLGNATNNSYAGTTTVTAGTLQVGVGGVGTTGTGITTVTATGTLAGTGTVRGTAVTHAINGILSPGDDGGNAVGNLNFEGNLTFGSTATSFFQLGAPTTPGTTYDRITGTTAATTLTLDGTINAADVGTDLFFGSYAPSFGDTWMLFDWTTSLAGIGTSFNVGTNLRTGADGVVEGDLDLPTLTGFFWDVSNFATDGTIMVVPEPSRALLLIAGLTAALLRRRRHHR